ncbi:Small RNA 2'-O-methyltransferase [Mactra antiquata]
MSDTMTEDGVTSNLDDVEHKEKGCNDSEEYLGGPMFEPPLYMQRYYFVEQALEKFNVKHVVDFGSAECKISRFLVQIKTLENLDLVDLDGNLLQCKGHAIRPLSCDYLDRRDLPLHIRMFHGSVTDLDKRLIGCDAVSMVELIEHLYPDILEKAVDMIFRQLQPNTVVMTTPNASYNQLFPNFSGMRHWDHKFEWTREEMKSWCEDICQRFPYSVEYGGIGDPPEDRRDLGHCSQYAIFVRNTMVPKIDTSSDAADVYRLVSESHYPYKENVQSEEDNILEELKYQIHVYQKSCPLTEDHSKSDYIANKCNKLTSVFESDVDTGIQSVYHAIENQSRSCDQSKSCDHTTRSCDKELQYCINCSRQRIERMSQQFIPVKYLMNRTIKKKMNMEELQSFLPHHGYNLSEDGLYVIVDYKHSEVDTDDDCNNGFHDDYDDDILDMLNDIDIVDDIPVIHSEFNTEEMLDCDLWELNS